MDEPLPIMAVIALGALFVAAIGVTIAATKHCETVFVRFVTIVITWAIPCLIIGAVGPTKVWRRISDKLEWIPKDTLVTPTTSPHVSATPTVSPMPSGSAVPAPEASQQPPSPTVTPSPPRVDDVIKNANPAFLRNLREALQHYVETTDSDFDSHKGGNTPTFPTSTPNETPEDDPSPPATPFDTKSYIYIANTTRVGLTIDVYERPYWLEHKIRAGSGVRLASKFSNLFIRICHKVPYKKFNGQWEIRPKRKREGPWLPKHELYVDKNHTIRLRTAGFIGD